MHRFFIKIKALFKSQLLVLLSTVPILTLLINPNVLASPNMLFLRNAGANNALFYNPEMVCFDNYGSGMTEVDPSNVFFSADDNASSLIGTLMANGYSQQAAAAIAGSIQAESG